MWLFLTDVEKGLLLACEGSGLSNKECARRLDRVVPALDGGAGAIKKAARREWPSGKAPDVLGAPAPKQTRPL